MGAAGFCGHENAPLNPPVLCLPSGTEAKTILPKKEKLKLRRERWLQSKSALPYRCTLGARAGEVPQHVCPEWL